MRQKFIVALLMAGILAFLVIMASAIMPARAYGLEHIRVRLRF
jgi:hypothetical protein